jgi:hypothetical protein
MSEIYRKVNMNGWNIKDKFDFISSLEGENLMIFEEQDLEYFSGGLVKKLDESSFKLDSSDGASRHRYEEIEGVLIYEPLLKIPCDTYSHIREKINSD